MVDASELLKQASSIFERDKSDPYTLMDIDRFLGTISTALPLVILAMAIFLGGDMYNVDGLAVFNPNRVLLGSGRHYETWNQMPYIRRHCWAELTNTDCFEDLLDPGKEECESLWLVHYSIVPYFLFGVFLVMYTAQAFWQIGKATEMANKVNYLIGGVEEAVRDVLDYLVVSAEDISKSNGKAKLNLAVERNLGKEVMANASKKEKYQILNSMMKEYANQRTYTTFFTLARVYFVVVIAAVNVGTWFLYLSPSKNPVSFECPLPEWLYYEDFNEATNRTQEFKTVKAVFEPVARRTLLMYIMFGIYCIIFIASVIGWATADSNNPGMDLLKKLPGMERYDSVGFSDLRYLMKLVYTNRKRVKFLRLAFDTMIATQRNSDSTENENDRYFSALREITLWSITDETDSELNKIINRQEQTIASAE